MTQLALLLIFAAALALGWLVATWWTADAQPAFGPALPGRVTFKTVLQGALRDLRDLLKLDLACRWLIRNAPALAAAAVAAFSALDPIMREAILKTPAGALIFFALIFFTSLKPAQS